MIRLPTAQIAIKFPFGLLGYIFLMRLNALQRIRRKKQSPLFLGGMGGIMPTLTVERMN
jgi:hypothetical protein